MTAYSIQEIRRFPVKLLGGETLESTHLTAQGLPYDRHWALFRSDTGARFRSAEALGALDLNARLLKENSHPVAEISFPDGHALATDDNRLDNAISEYFCLPLTLRECEGNARPFHYDSPITLLAEASLRFLQQEAPHSLLSNRRFRANILLADSEGKADWMERRWAGREVALGKAQLAVAGNVERCIVVTRAQRAFENEPALPRDPAIIKALIRLTAKQIAVHCRVKEAGEIRLNDPACPA